MWYLISMRNENNNLKGTKMKLTPLEKDILNHRLEVPDSIIDALTDNDADEFGNWHPVDIEYVAERLLAGEFKDAIYHNEAITHAVLIDAVEGSTYWAVADGAGKSSQKIGSIIKAGQSLAVKIQEFTESNRELEFPLY